MPALQFALLSEHYSYCRLVICALENIEKSPIGRVQNLDPLARRDLAQRLIARPQLQLTVHDEFITPIGKVWFELGMFFQPAMALVKMTGLATMRQPVVI